MNIQLTDDERILILNSLKIAQYFYEKLNRVKAAAEARRLYNLMFYVDNIHIETCKLEGLQTDELQQILNLRENILKRGNVIEYPIIESGISDPGDLDEIEADRDFARLAKEWQKEHNKDD